MTLADLSMCKCMRAVVCVYPQFIIDTMVFVRVVTRIMFFSGVKVTHLFSVHVKRAATGGGRCGRGEDEWRPEEERRRRGAAVKESC